MLREALVRTTLALGVYRPVRLAYEKAWRRELVREQRALLERLGPWIEPGDLVFDIGAHMGRFALAARRLGARVVAVEPNPATARELRGLHGPDRDLFRLVQAAVGSEAGHADLQINAHRHSMCTLSDRFVEQTRKHAAWAADDRWDNTVRVPVVTLDRLVSEHGTPKLLKLDVEGFELAALQGLSTAPDVVCFEARPYMAEDAVGCVQKLETLGGYGFDFIGADDRRTLNDWVTPGAMIRALQEDERATSASHIDVLAVRRADHTAQVLSPAADRDARKAA
ncbi:MAG: FkbM family methyltransferase [Planctomycetota bacterium]